MSLMYAYIPSNFIELASEGHARKLDCVPANRLSCAWSLAALGFVPAAGEVEDGAPRREEVRERVDAVGEGHACPEAQRQGLSATGDRSGWQSGGDSRQFLLPVAASTFGHQASLSLVLSVTALPSALNT